VISLGHELRTIYLFSHVMRNTDSSKPVERIILGVDPGTVAMGYGIVKVEGKKLEMMGMGIIQLSKYDNHAIRLKHIFNRIVSLIDEFNPDELSIEAPFYGKNVQSMLKLGRAQGVAIAACLSRDIPYVEYAPKKIKQSITGNGSSSKQQVAGMITSILNLKEIPKSLDATDALGAAICHYYQSNSPIQGGKKYSDWKSFIQQNPNVSS
jgi:crossover junction endodeoxyribonuclease RuvC